MAYSHRYISLNNRDIVIEDIVSGKAHPVTPFEASTLTFIREWLTGKHEFQVTTSGSTGLPKTISFTRAQMQESARLTLQALQLMAGDVALICLSTNYIAGKMMLVRALTGDLRIVAVEPSSNPFLSIDVTHAVFAAVVPLQLYAVLQHQQSVEKVNQMKVIIVGGAAVTHELKLQIQKYISIPVYATYGMTETISHVALQKLTGINPQNFFKLLPGIHISQDDRQCLVVQTSFLQEPVITNDIISIPSNDSFEWLGRYDNVINSGGVKVIAERVEAELKEVFNSLALQRRFYITGFPHERLGQEVTLVIEGNRLNSGIEKQILEKASVRVSKFEIPRSIHYIPLFTETPTGKIVRQQKKG